MNRFAILLLTLCAAATLRADAIYDVKLDTSGLAPGTYYLDFQLISGDTVIPNANNTVIVDFLGLSGGAPTAPPTLNGGASGAFATGFNFTDSQFFNAALVPVTFGTQLSFRMSYTTNYTSGFPDEFSFAVLDSSMTSIVSSGVGASLVVDITGLNAVPAVFAADAAYGGITPALSAVPEPATGMLAVPLLALLWRQRRKRISAAARQFRPLRRLRP